MWDHVCRRMSALKSAEFDIRGRRQIARSTVASSITLLALGSTIIDGSYPSLAIAPANMTIDQGAVDAAPSNGISTSEAPRDIRNAKAKVPGSTSAQVAETKLTPSQSLPVDSSLTRTPAGSPQHPNLLSAYVARPPWRVAGVDYYVGITPGTVLKPITSINMPGVAIDEVNHLIRITGPNVTIDGYDFSGWCLYVQGQNVTIQNCYSNNVGGFGIVGRNDGMYNGVNYTSSNITIRNCEIDGTGDQFENQWSFINIKGTGTTTVEYNYFHDAPTHVFEFEGTSTLLYKYNLEEDIGIDPTGQGPTDHVNYTQMLGGQSVNSQIAYNTMIQHSQPAGGQMIQVTGSNALVANNTMIAYPTSSGGASISHMIDPGHAGDFFQGIIKDNYIDRRGALDAFYPSATRPNVLVTDNINMVTGRIIQANNTERARKLEIHRTGE
jgi:hypothetical protein